MAAIPALASPQHRGIAAGDFQLVFITGGSVGSAAIGGLAGILSLRASLAVLAAIPLAGMLAARIAGSHAHAVRTAEETKNWSR